MNSMYYISHGGPGSGRYPLGSGDRPYQKFEKEKKRTSGISEYIRKRKAEKAEKQEKKRQKEESIKKIEQENAKRNHDQDKERVLREGSATEVLKYRGELTNQELQNAYTRLTLENQLGGLSQKEIKTMVDKVNNVAKGVKMGTEWLKIGIDSYNTLATIYNSTSDKKKEPLPIIGKAGK